MAWKSDVVIRLNKDAIKKGLILPTLVVYTESAQNIVGDAKKNHPYTDRTTNNTRRLGWAVSGPDQTGFGSLTTTVGETSTRGSGKTSPRGEIAAMAAGSSGYQGWLEIGHRSRAGKPVGPYPHLYPAYERELPKMRQALTKIA